MRRGDWQILWKSAMKTIHTSIREYLSQNEILTYRISGRSMRPMLRQEEDLVVLRRYDGTPLRKYDVALYDTGGGGRYVLHRVVEVKDGYYTFLGDNCLMPEEGISGDTIVAVLESFIRRGKRISVHNVIYQAYGRLHLAMFPVRRSWRQMKGLAAHIPALRRLWHILKRIVKRGKA